MNLQQPPSNYDQNFETERNRNLVFEDSLNRKKLQDIEIVGNERLILSSPDGTRYSLTVTNAGVFQVVSLTGTTSVGANIVALSSMSASAHTNYDNAYNTGNYNQGNYAN
tara:strand:- start:24 stop:353 length:330 start_codon:yes stop_codon:yes gene_type:complete